MLAADKLLLQSNVKQRSIELREKELNLFNSNFSAVGTQAAIMAGFTLTSFVEIDLPPNKRWAKALLHCFVCTSICVNFVCVSMVTFVTVWGSGKALRGQDGSMDYAVDAMNAGILSSALPSPILPPHATTHTSPANFSFIPPLFSPRAQFHLRLFCAWRPCDSRLSLLRRVGAHGDGDCDHSVGPHSEHDVRPRLLCPVTAL